jgi:hypothetical protein
MDFQMRNKTFISSMVGIAAAVATSAQAAVVGTTLNTLNPASPMTVSDGISNGAAAGLLPGLAIDCWNSGAISGGTVTFTENNPTLATGSFGKFQARALTGTTVDLSAFSSGGIRFTYSGVWAAASPTLQVKILVNDGTSTTYTASVSTPSSATGLTINWSQFVFGSSNLGANLNRLSSVNMVEIGATGFSSLVVSDLEVVPAPGALALLGVAGLVGARRRRA